jgi:hypothetical protein
MNKTTPLKTATTLKDFHVYKFGYNLVIPAGSKVSNQTAMGPDDNYRFWTDYRTVLVELTGYKNSMLHHDVEHYGVNVPAELCEPYPND